MLRKRLGTLFVIRGGACASACMLLVAVGAASAYAQSTDLPGIEITAPPKRNAAPKAGASSSGQPSPAPNASTKGACGDRKDSNEPPSLDCLNADLKQKVDRVNRPDIQAPLDARSPDVKTGVVNIPGVKEQYGQNFGKSVVPYRPPQPVFAPPLARH
jgi:hypothetical protein